ncbi:LPS export ABC transporter permease LptG [Aliigemmobacter aestuarii]|uniref:LPS export ABC transporter permease LptG n=1 Tax=Aliigemmobacter aestuarii TaxID=1445661 RepID=A0A4S3MLS0_9RHOB|nr:LPS export ABC transporter permease LptG [Gemmobacter aestuarii]THD82965.1 LPS export ABC transporter permease LptG [Gemmobacter aestuarii]
MTLSLYIARRFLRTFGTVFMVFFGILFLIDIIEQLRRFSDKGIGMGQAAHLAALSVPESLYRILPLIMILSAIALFLGLARSSELVVVRAAGRSGLRFLVTPVIVALALGSLAVAVLNPLVAATSKEYDALWARLAQGRDSALSISDAGLWLRQGSPEGQTVIHSRRASGDGTELFGATFLTFDGAGVPQRRIEAASARLDQGYWELDDAKIWDLTAANPETAARSEAAAVIPSDLTRDAIRDSFGTPSAIPVWDLPDYIAGLERAGFSARSHQVWLQMELAQPLLLAAMVLVAAGFTMRHARFGRTGTMVLFALLGGFSIFFLRNFAQVLGENGQIPILMAAWVPPLAAAMLATGLLLHLEDG